VPARAGVYDATMAYPPSGPAPGWGAPPGGGFGSPPHGQPPGGGWEPPTQPPRGSSSDYTTQLVVAFVLSFVSFFCCSIFCIIPLIPAIVAAVQGSKDPESARKWANFSMITAIVMIVLSLIFWVCYIVLMLVLGMSQPSYSGY
jgi:hypothetical protein